MRLVNIEPLENHLKEMCDNLSTNPRLEAMRIITEGYWKKLKSLPTVEMPDQIVHCRDCMYYKTDHSNANGYHCCYRNHNIFPMNEDDYCSRAERKEDSCGDDSCEIHYEGE